MRAWPSLVFLELSAVLLFLGVFLEVFLAVDTSGGVVMLLPGVFPSPCSQEFQT